MTTNPWRALRALPHLLVLWTTDLPPGRRGATDGQTIWMRDGLLQRERRSTLAHELEHIRRGHGICQSERSEAAVRHHAARRLLPNLQEVVDALVYHRGCVEAAAEDLWVDAATVRARLDPRHLHPAEKATIARRLAAEAENSWA